MLNIILVILAVLVVAVIALLVIGAFKPNHFRVERSLDIGAAPEKIFPYLNDLRQQRLWSPWDQKDPNMKRTYSGAERGVGAKYAWDGNKEIGAGSQEITGVTPYSGVDVKIDFIKPFAANNRIEFRLRPAGANTNVSWAIFGPHPYFFRVMSVLCNMDRMIGREFEKGLVQLKGLAEK